MSSRIFLRSGLLSVRAGAYGPTGELGLWLALDTGSFLTLLRPEPIALLGYGTADFRGTRAIATAASLDVASELESHGLAVLGHRRERMPILVRSLAPGIAVDGLLGLDFFARHRLIINFLTSTASLD